MAANLKIYNLIKIQTEAMLMATLTMLQKALSLLGGKLMGICIVVMICDYHPR